MEKPRKKRKIAKKHCFQCDELFTPKRTDQKFCSAYCRFKEWAKNNPRVKLCLEKKPEKNSVETQQTE